MNEDCQIITIMLSKSIQIANLAPIQSINNSVNKMITLLQYDFIYSYASCNRNVVKSMSHQLNGQYCFICGRSWDITMVYWPAILNELLSFFLVLSGQCLENTLKYEYYLLGYEVVQYVKNLRCFRVTCCLHNCSNKP